MTIAGSGIRFRHPSPYEHQQHGKAERKHRHIVELGLTLLAQASMPLSYWREAFSTTIFVINRLTSPILSNVSPFQKLFGQ